MNPRPSPDPTGGSAAAGGGSAPAALRIRRATPDDADLLAEMIRELARFERLEAECDITDEAVRVHLLGPQRCAEALIAWLGEAPAGFAVYYRTFSTFAGRPGIFMEDLFVRPPFRERGIGRALLGTFGQRAERLGAGRFEWTTLKWNGNARRLYAGIGAKEREEWLLLRMEGDALSRFRCGGAGTPTTACRCGGRGPHHPTALPT